MRSIFNPLLPVEISLQAAVTYISAALSDLSYMLTAFFV